MIYMKNVNQHLLIIVPSQIGDLPIEIICDKELSSPTDDNDTTTEIALDRVEIEPKRESLIWSRGEFVRVSLDDIIRIEADGSYSIIHLRDKHPIIISYPLNIVERSLPSQHFLRIHRSMIVNIIHITHMVGNSFRICGELYTIGREYRQKVKSHFVFLGVKR